MIRISGKSGAFPAAGSQTGNRVTVVRMCAAVAR
jgi:hypothetical protein